MPGLPARGGKIAAHNLLVDERDDLDVAEPEWLGWIAMTNWSKA
jgi:hypothetical protein